MSLNFGALLSVFISHLFLCFEVSKVSEEFSLRWELSRLQEMQQTEELFHSVLERSAGQQHFVFLRENHGAQGEKLEMKGRGAVEEGRRCNEAKDRKGEGIGRRATR